MKKFVIHFIFCTVAGMALHAQQIDSVKVTELVSRYTSQKGVVVVNFWSTWCRPCVEEIPHFLKVYDSLKDSGVQLWLVSQDTRELYRSGKLKSFLAKKEGWDRAKLFWFSETNADYYCPLIDKDWSGVIPATLILNPSKGYSRFFEESLTAEKLAEEVGKAL